MSFLAFLKTLVASDKLDVAQRFSFECRAISGSMSKFYKASDRETGGIVGLKILDPLRVAAFEGRFKGLLKPTEGEIAAQLDHPNIVRISEHGITTEGSPYLVMECLEGPSLQAALAARASFLTRRRAHFVRQAAEATAAVHRAGLIHRNICPRHLLLANGHKDIKLIDFGLALPATGPFMRPGNRTGTPDYMAPELIRRQPTDQRLDVYAFGVTAYEMCTCELPWPRGAVGAAAMTHELPPIDIRQRCPTTTLALARAIHACLEPEVSLRCPSMDAFLQMIRDVPDDGGMA